ncbi:MAG: DUF1028 domain-containing protein [Ferruginibacter sp.]
MKFLLILLLFTMNASAQFYNKESGLAHTFSIVARDSATGEMGIGVQSHWFSVGTAVSWAEAGVGVVATQSFVNKSLGIKGLALMKSGMSAADALAQLLKEDEGRDVRQVAMLDVHGSVAAHTGKNCIEFADHITGINFSVQSNMMLTNKVCKAMSKSFQSTTKLPLAERIMLALNAAQTSGGDIRGKQSAALLVVPGTSTGKPWDEISVDLRVDDNEAPLKEMDRLLKVHRAYQHMNNGDLFVEKMDMVNAMKEYNAAMKFFPNNLEMKYWTAITFANNGNIGEALSLLKVIYQKDGNWRELTRRLPKAGLLNVSASNLQLLLK